MISFTMLLGRLLEACNSLRDCICLMVQDGDYSVYCHYSNKKRKEIKNIGYFAFDIF